MSLRKCLLSAMLFTVVALAAYGWGNAYRAISDELNSNAWLHSAKLAAAASPWHGSQQIDEPSQWSGPLCKKDDSRPALFVPIQFKDPRNLGVGKLLVASRSLRDPNFAETVVLLVHYDAKGVLGLVLNRRTGTPLSRVLDLKAAKDRSDPIYLGGPVGLSNAFALYQSSVKMKKAEDIFGEVYLISDKSLFERVLSSGPTPKVFHVYLGYAGWAQEQLRAEVQLGAWYIFPADSATVFNSHPDTLWLQMIQKTQLQWARTEPFAETRPVELFRSVRSYSPGR